MSLVDNVINRTLADKVEGVDILNENGDRRILTERWKEPGDLAAFKKIQANIYIGNATTKRLPDLYKTIIGLI